MRSGSSARKWGAPRPFAGRRGGDDAGVTVRVGPRPQDQPPPVDVDLAGRTVSVDVAGVRVRGGRSGWSVQVGDRGVAPLEAGREVPEFDVTGDGFQVLVNTIDTELLSGFELNGAATGILPPLEQNDTSGVSIEYDGPKTVVV